MNQIKSDKRIDSQSVEDQQNAHAHQLFALSDELEKFSEKLQIDELQEISRRLQIIALNLVPLPDMDDEEIKRLFDAAEQEMQHEDLDKESEPESDVSRTKLTKANVAVFRAISKLKKGA